MAQQGHNGGHHEDNGADTASYIFNPMSYNYNQHQSFSPPTVLSQQDASLMADFFNNPDTSGPDTNTYLGYGIDSNSNHHGLTSDQALTNPHVQGSHVNFTTHSMPQARGLPVNMYEYSASFLQNNHHPQHQHSSSSNTTNNANNNNSSHSPGDAVAGASALLGLSTSQEQASLLGANSYMTWPNIVGAHLQAPMNNGGSTTTTVSAVRSSPIKSNSTSQLHPQLQAPPTPVNTWADIQAQELQMRARHPSLQLDTSSTHFPTHQQSWQTAPQSAAPHVGRRPTMVKFGSDNHFSPHGFTGPALAQQEEKQNNLMHMAATGDLAADAVQVQRSVPTLSHRHSIAGGAPITPGPHHSAAMSGPMSASAVHQLQGPFHTGINAPTASIPSGRKRTFSQVDSSNAPQGNVDLTRQVSNLSDVQDQRAPSTRPAANGTPAAANTATSVTQAVQVSPPQNAASAANPANQRRRNNAREPRAPRQNLTDAQKRQNHIASEQKRRDTMKTNYEILGQRVPAVRDGGAMSRSEILYHVANHLEAIIAGNNVMAGLAGVTLQQLDDMSDSEDDQSESNDA